MSSGEVTLRFRDEESVEMRAGESLGALERAIQRDLDILDYPSKPWLKPVKAPDGSNAYDVVVVGGGHCGITIGFALMRERISNMVVIDENPPGEEGPWKTYARMPDLRTRKTVTGTELGFPNLTFRAFYEAREGADAYAKLQRISCDEWMGYLHWLRNLLKVPVENGTRMSGLEPAGKLLRLTVERQGRTEAIYARRVVLAFGPVASGGINIPDVVKNALPRTAYAHVYERIDLGTLKGKRVAVVGAGASALDNAGAALEAGAASVDLLVRRPKIPRLSLIRWTDFSAFLNTYADLGDAEKWQLMQEVQRNAAPPTLRALERVQARKSFRIHFSSPMNALRMNGGEIEIDTPGQAHKVDFLLLATGFALNMKNCPALAPICDQIALWSDRYTPPGAPGPEKYRNSPYLGRHYELQEKVPGTAPYLRHIFNYNQSATLSMGPTGRVSGLKYGSRRLMLGVLGSFLREDFDRYMADIRRYNDSELDGHPWVEPKPDVAPA